MGAPPSTPTWFEWITVAAIVIGPILALWVQRLLDTLRDRDQQRKRIFLTLMSTRATPLSAEHVNALNSIHVIFNRRKDQKVREAWRNFLSQLNLDANQLGWQERVNDLRVDLLREIGRLVGFNFTTDSLKREIYYPRLFSDMDADNLKLRQRLLKVLSDEGLKITVAAPTAASDTAHRVD